MHASTRDDSTRPRPGAAKAIVGILIAGLLALPGGARAQQGVLTQRPGAEGCISQGGSEQCTDADLLFGAFSVAVSNDGRNAYVAFIDGRGVAALARDRKTGALTQLPSPMGCISQTGTGGLCVTGKGLNAPLSVAISPDGKNVYVASFQKDPVSISALALFARNVETGELTQLPGAQGCISEDIGGGVCTPGIALRGPTSVAVSRDGKNVYVAGLNDAVAVFARDDETGALTQLPEPQGCISQSGNGGHCTKGKALDGADSVALSKDGRFVYVAAEVSRAIAVFSRNTRTGALTQLPGEDGCISQDGSVEVCTNGVGLGGPLSVALSPSDTNVYAASGVSNELAVLARDRRTGKLSSVLCIKQDGSVVCDSAVALRRPEAVIVSPNGKQVYVVARESDAVAVFAHDKKTGSVTQLPSTAGCISDDGTEGLCTDARALNGPRSVTISKDGRHVYVAAQQSAAVAVLQRRR